MTPLLRIENLQTYYGQLHALKGINLEVRGGEIVTLIGSNGAGKSTTLQSISGLITPRSGRILFNGADITGTPAHEVAALGIAHVPEGRRIFPQLTVEENLDIGGYLDKDPASRARHKQIIYDLFTRLGERRKQMGGTLSGGEQQMLAIGRALMRDPQLLLLDEPTLGLAPVVVASIFETITRLNREGKTILLVEQNAWQALRVANRGYVLRTGQIILNGSASDLANNDTVRSSYLGGE